jgi:hypothetical protein
VGRRTRRTPSREQDENERVGQMSNKEPVFAVGDVVTLKSGSVGMTVTSVNG